VLTERLNSVFSSGQRPCAAQLFEPRPQRTLCSALVVLGVARTAEEMEAVQSLPLSIQITLRALLWENLKRSEPLPVHWVWTPAVVPELGVLELPCLGGGRASITIHLRTPPLGVPPSVEPV
jgi:hypothetical protein